MKFILSSMFGAIVLILFAWVPVMAENKPLAKGDGIVITSKEVAALTRFYYDRGFKVAKSQELPGALRVLLLAREAYLKGLDPEVHELDFSEAETMVRLRNLYLQKVLEDYPVSSRVIESYYHAHPERYEHQFVRLNRDTREEIAWIIRRAKSRTLEAQALEDLKNKYNVRICGPHGECD